MRYQARTGERTRPYPVSLNQTTIDGLHEIKLASGESHGAIVRRLVEHERDRIREIGIPKALVWTSPSYFAEGDRVDTRVIYRTAGREIVFEAQGERLKPNPPIGSYVLIQHEGKRLHGQLVRAETDTSSDDSPLLLLTVRGLNPAAENGLTVSGPP